MPIYEYECPACGGFFQKLLMNKEEEAGLCCPQCGGDAPKRIISRVAYHVSESHRLAAYDSQARQDDGFYRDSRNIGLHAKKRAQEMGVDLGEAFESKLEKLRTDPGSVIRDSE